MTEQKDRNPLATQSIYAVEEQNLQFDRERVEDIGFMTCMTLVLLGNYAQTGHFGGPLAYTPYNVALHLAGPELGGLRYDIRRPKHPYCDKFMLAGGHNIPTGYALWMIMCQAMERKFRRRATRDIMWIRNGHLADRRAGIPPRRGALKTCCRMQGWRTIRCLRRPKARGIKALAGPCGKRPTSTNDVNGGPSGVGIAAAAGKAAFWDIVGAPAVAEGDRARRRVRHDRRPRAGDQDAGAGAAGGQAAARDAF